MQWFDFCVGEHLPPCLWSLGIYKLHWSGRSLKLHLPHSGIANSYWRGVDYLCKPWTFREVYRTKILWEHLSRCLHPTFQDPRFSQSGPIRDLPWLSIKISLQLLDSIKFWVCSSAVHRSTAGDRGLFIRYQWGSLTLTLSICCLLVALSFSSSHCRVSIQLSNNQPTLLSLHTPSPHLSNPWIIIPTWVFSTVMFLHVPTGEMFSYGTAILCPVFYIPLRMEFSSLAEQWVSQAPNPFYHLISQNIFSINCINAGEPRSRHQDRITHVRYILGKTPVNDKGGGGRSRESLQSAMRFFSVKRETESLSSWIRWSLTL